MRALHLLARRLALRGVDEEEQVEDVLQAVGHPGVGRLAVAPGPPGLLVVGLEALRQVEMGDEAHVGPVDPHAEGDGGDHHHPFAGAEAVERRAAVGGAHAGVVGQRLDPLLGEPGGGRLDLGAREAVDDPGVPGVLLPQEGEELAARVLGLVDDAVAEVRPVEAGDEDPRPLELQAGEDLAPRRRVGGGGERDARHPGEALGQQVEPQVLGAEVVPPLGDAVRLVDGEEADRGPRRAARGSAR